MPNDPRVSYGVALLVTRINAFVREVLLLERSGAHAAGTWSCPGGWVDFGEDAYQAVIREAKEELGLVISASRVRFFGLRENIFATENVQSLTLYFHTEMPPDQSPQIMEPAKCGGFRWIPLHQPETWPVLFPKLRDVLGDLRDQKFGDDKPSFE